MNALVCRVVPLVSVGLLASAVLGACGSSSGPGAQTGAPADSIAAVVNAADRDPADKAQDASRKPAALLAFAGIQPGMKVGDAMAGFGYTTEILARAVGPSGKVLAQNNKLVLKFVAKGWEARLAKPVNSNVQRVDAELESVFPAGSNLDAILFVLFYHDAPAIGVDRPKMNKAFFDALKPGGKLIIVDAHAKEGAGTTVGNTLHRIEQKVVEQEVTAAGFKLDGQGDFMRVPSDSRDWNVDPAATKPEQRVKVDRFVLKFVKP